ncbi:MAG: glucosaminidase domain-containing protein [Hyphomicrobiaceae bacterium]
MRLPRQALRNLAAATLGLGSLGIAAGASFAASPAIRISDYNKVPACVTPARLMHYVRERNQSLDRRYDDIAKWYKQHGETWRVRWDYAFFQMIVETNHLKFHTGSGRSGDVRPKQNNFAGIGTTGGGVPGDGYPDVSTGVLAQVQHLVAYSGERIDKPVAPRTQKAQDDIIAISARLMRTVTFADLAGRWAVDRRYWRTIEGVAERFREVHCNGQSPIPEEPEPKLVKHPLLVKPPIQVAMRQRSGIASTEPRPTITTASLASVAIPAATVVVPAVPRALPPPPLTCKVQSASFVGKGGAHRTLLIKSQSGNEVHYTTLQVLDGFERSMADSFIQARAPGGNLIGSFDSSDAATAKANEMCAMK